MPAPTSRPAAAGLALLALLAATLVGAPLVQWTRAHEREQACRLHLQQLGSALLVYRASAGRWPDARGGAVLRRLVDAGIVTDPTILRCPASGDPADACSYAAWDTPPPRDPFAWRGAPATRVAAGDDDRGAPRFNHGDRRVLLLLDGRVVVWRIPPDGRGLPPDLSGRLVD